MAAILHRKPDIYTMNKLRAAFYLQQDVVAIARSLLGKILVTHLDGCYTSGRIVETEAYNGITDKASHAWGGRRTLRTATMYGPGGIAYVYTCYGLHQLFNVVTNEAEVPHAVLIRALEPLEGIPYMLHRRQLPTCQPRLTSGPGSVARAMGIGRQHNQMSLLGDEIFIAEDAHHPNPYDIVTTPRIGVDYAAEDAQLPYRFYIKGSLYVSGTKKQNAY